MKGSASFWGEQMKVTLLDTKTGRRHYCDKWDFPVRWWTAGNGSCDCNRAIASGGRDLEDAQRKALGIAWGLCIGAKRWLIVDVTDTEGETREQVLADANSDYPPELVAQYMTPNVEVSRDAGTPVASARPPG